MDRACGMYGEEEKCTEAFGGETRMKDSLGIPKHRCEDNIKMYLKNRLGRLGLQSPGLL
jgi:hypothetical protein